MTTSHSKSWQLQQVDLLCAWAKARKLTPEDLNLIVETAVTLNEADGALKAARKFADMVRGHCAMQLAAIPASARGNSPDAFDVLEQAAKDVIEQIDYASSAERCGSGPADGMPHVYEVSSGEMRVMIRSSQAMTVDEVCEMALRNTGPAKIEPGAIMEVTSDEFGGPDDPIYVSTMHQLINAGLLLQGGAK